MAPKTVFAATWRGRWRRARGGTTMLEFAIVAPVFLGLMLGIMEIGYDLYVQAALDHAVARVARSIQVGATFGIAGDFKDTAKNLNAAVCNAVAGLLDCSKIVVGVAAVPAGQDYLSNSNAPTLAQASSSSGDICTGTQAQPMVLAAWYKGPTFVASLYPGFSTTDALTGNTVHITAATSGFVNEPGITGEAGC